MTKAGHINHIASEDACALTYRSDYFFEGASSIPRGSDVLLVEKVEGQVGVYAFAHMK